MARIPAANRSLFRVGLPKDALRRHWSRRETSSVRRFLSASLEIAVGEGLAGITTPYTAQRVLNGALLLHLGQIHQQLAELGGDATGRGDEQSILVGKLHYPPAETKGARTLLDKG